LARATRRSRADVRPGCISFYGRRVSIGFNLMLKNPQEHLPRQD